MENEKNKYVKNATKKVENKAIYNADFIAKRYVFLKFMFIYTSNL
jgi:hypothetical protein